MKRDAYKIGNIDKLCEQLLQHCVCVCAFPWAEEPSVHSTVTDLARFLGQSTWMRNKREWIQNIKHQAHRCGPEEV